MNLAHAAAIAILAFVIGLLTGIHVDREGPSSNSDKLGVPRAEVYSEDSLVPIQSEEEFDDEFDDDFIDEFDFDGESDDAIDLMEETDVDTVTGLLEDLEGLVDELHSMSGARAQGSIRHTALEATQTVASEIADVFQLTNDHVRRLQMCGSTNVFAAKQPVLVGAYYYPWWGAGGNFHNGQGYVRRELTPQQLPTLGEYDDSRAAIIKKHVEWSNYANIKLWATSWWGPGSDTDVRIRTKIFPQLRYGLKIALVYESTNRFKSNGAWTTENIESDMQHMCSTYFGRSKYHRIDGRPVLIVYVTRVLEANGVLEEGILKMRRAVAQACGEDVYLIGDHVFWSAPELGESDFSQTFLYFDAITNYDVYGSMIHGREIYYAGKTMVDEYYKQQEDWKQAAAEHGCRFVPAISPGFNDRGVRLDKNHTALSRRLSPGAPEGSLFKYALPKCKALADPLVQNLILVNSFNEWHEDTQIEPCKAKWKKANKVTVSPEDYTNGLSHSAYGGLYLKLLKVGTK